MRNLGFRVSVEIQRGAKLGPCGECAGKEGDPKDGGRKRGKDGRESEGRRKGRGQGGEREGGNLTVGEDIGCLNPQPSTLNPKLISRSVKTSGASTSCVGESPCENPR